MTQQMTQRKRRGWCRRIPEKVVAVRAERRLFEESSDEFMSHHFVYFRVLNSTASLGNSSTVSRGTCVHRTYNVQRTGVRLCYVRQTTQCHADYIHNSCWNRDTDYHSDPFFSATRFVFSFFLICPLLVPCAIFSWPFRQLLSARKYTISYIVSITMFHFRPYVFAAPSFIQSTCGFLIFSRIIPVLCFSQNSYPSIHFRQS